jgi:hypothetical protein
VIAKIDQFGSALLDHIHIAIGAWIKGGANMEFADGIGRYGPTIV